jgi:hypothetical protein
MTDGQGDLETLKSLPTEGVEHMFAGACKDTGAPEEVVNVTHRATPNGPQAISHFPDDVRVEVPGALPRDGTWAEAIAAQPEPSGAVERPRCLRSPCARPSRGAAN